ncbi:P-loop NTPase fold protein [Coprobacillaceae bacterium CR2/5/TPMF4]|nr:P-loop NTPase fold protein [Coprobacillaceae bacterium CR2/5/TPMF4]
MCERANINMENVDINELDILGRDEFVDNCRLLINTIFDTTKSAFIMIDGEWGVGKTFVINMLDKKLRDDYNIIKYNCWENSYYNDPLEAILSVMLDYNDKGSLWSNADKEKFKALGIIALNLLTLGGIEILNKAAGEIEDYINQNDKNIYTIIQEVKDYINLNEEKIIILVDEIDRCLPEYGVKTLERLYLLFKDAPNIVIIIANDKSKMEISIQNAFGYKSIDNYLEKFIDYTLKLDTSEQFKNRELFEQKYSYYLDNFELYGSFWKLCNVLFLVKT